MNSSDTLNKRKRTILIIIVIFCLLLVFIKIREHSLIKNGIILNAKTTNWATGAKLSIDLRYEFYFKGKKLVGNNAKGKITGNKEFENRYFPVVYDPKLGMSELLITPKDFKKYNISFPDSLNWVLQYLR